MLDFWPFKINAPRARVRVALFCSFYRGRAMLERALQLQVLYPEIEICGIATDDPTKSWTSPNKRIWKYPHTQEEERMVASLAQQNGFSPWLGRIKGADFEETFTKEWIPDVCYMGVFGQKIPESIWSQPLFGFYNFHSCAGKIWPSNIGGDPLTSLLAEGSKEGSLAMHQIDNDWDRGSLLAFSEFFPITSDLNVVKTHKETASIAADMMEWHLLGLLGIQSDYAPRFVAEEQGLPYLRALAKKKHSVIHTGRMH